MKETVSSSGSVSAGEAQKKEPKQEVGLKGYEFAKEEAANRPLVQHTFYLLNKLANDFGVELDSEEELGGTEEEKQERLKELFTHLWKEISVHGIVRIDPETGEKSLLKFTDLDGRSCLEILRIAGIDLKDQEIKLGYVFPGDTVKSGAIFDSGGVDGTATREAGKIYIDDHHGKDSDKDTSAAKYFYEELVREGILKKEEYLDRFVEFVTKCDNENYSDRELKKVFDNYHKNLYGLRNKIDTSEILALFRRRPRRNPADPLDEYYLNNNNCSIGNGKARRKTLSECSEELEKAKKEAKAEIEELEKKGFVLDVGGDHKVLIDTKKENGYPKVNRAENVGQLAARYRGYDGYLIWSPGEDQFKFYSYHKRKIDDGIVPRGMINVRGNYLLRDTNDSEPLDVTMEEFMKTLSGGEINPELKAALEKEAKERAEKSMPEPVAIPEKNQPSVKNERTHEDEVAAAEPDQKNLGNDGTRGKETIESDASALIDSVFKNGSFEGSSEEEYLKEIRTYIENGGTIDVKVAGEEGWRIAAVNTESGMVVVENRSGDEIKSIPKIISFKQLQEWNADLFKEMLTQKEIEICDIYEEGVKEMIGHIRGMDWSGFGYDPDDAGDLADINIRAYFRRLKAEMVKEGHFNSEERVELAIKRLIKSNDLDFLFF
ncbi:MAG: hypothetical protein HGB08_03975 [Candidatus Moranbacteria bacterium]|nr:hypothetical protein [Candidatus Moranbacteria bacterium]